MKVISHEFSISVEEMEKFVDGLTDGDLQKVLERIAVYYVPDPEEIKKQVLDLSKGTPLHSLIPITITDWEGRPIAKVGSIEDDLEGRVVNQTSQYMSVSSVFLRATIDKIKSKFNPTCEELINHIAKSPLFVEDNREIVSIGISLTWLESI